MDLLNRLRDFPTPVTFPLRPPTPPAAQIRQNSGRKYVNKEVCMYIRTLKPLKTRKEKEELKFKHPGSTNCDVIISDVMVSGVTVTELDSDVTRQDVNKPIARKRYAQKHSFMSKMGLIKSSLRVCSRTFTKVAFILAIVISILGGLCNIKLPERKSSIGTSSSLSRSEPRVVLSFLDSSVLSSLRESAAAIFGISEGLCSCIYKGMFLNNNKQLIRYMKVLQNTIKCEETICTNHSLSSRLKLAALNVYPDYATYALATFTKNVLAGKRLVTYIFLFADFCTSPIYYLDTYTVNLELDDNFKVFYDLVYLYIYLFFYRSWSSCNWATYPKAILVNMYTLVYVSSNLISLVIKSHDKYQSLILIGLACAEKTSSGNRSVLVHYRSYWREW